MRKTGFNKIFGLIFLFFLVSCGATKNISTGNEATELSEAEFIKNVQKQKAAFTHLNIQSTIDADLGGTRASMNGKIYIKNGEKIWINVSKFGLTAARALITPKEVQAYEKLNRTYIDSDFSYFNQLLKVDFIDFDKLQNLMLGRIFIDLNPKEYNFQLVDNQYKLAYEENQKILKSPKPGKYFQEYYFDNSFRLVRALLKDPSSDMELDIDYSGWTAVGSQYFPKYVKVLVKDKKSRKVELEYNNFTFEESPTPFTIPSGYEPNGILK